MNCKRFILSSILVGLFSLLDWASELHTNNLIIGFTPLCKTTVDPGREYKGNQVKYQFSPCWKVVLGKEQKFFRMPFNMYFELTGGLNKFSKIVDVEDEIDYLHILVDSAKDAWSVSAACFFGQSFSKKRFQISYYIGFGSGYYRGGELHHFTPFGGLKLRASYYLTNRLAVYAGGNMNIGCQGESYLDAGIAYNL